MRTTPHLFAVAMFTLLAAACSDGPDSGSETHWLGCETEADCPLGAMCVNGQCSGADAGNPGLNNTTGGNNENNANNVGNNGTGNNTNGVNNTPIADAGMSADMGSSSDMGADFGADADVGIPVQPDIEVLGDDLVFFSLPIGSDRAAISGYDATRDLCVSVIWMFGSADDRPPGGFCDHDTEQMRPYVYVEEGVAAGCWDYSGNAEVVDVSGCADFSGYGAGHTDLADEVLVEVTSPLFNGVVRFDNQ